MFANRNQAGRALAEALQHYYGRGDTIVLGLPRGGVPVAAEVATALDLPLDVMIVRKVGAPFQPELALGAVASGGVTVFNQEIVGLLGGEDKLRQYAADQLEEVARREQRFRGDRPPLELRGRTVILVDDGSATGASMLAAVRATRALGAQRVVVALPVAAPEACQKLDHEADEVVCLSTPALFRAVGEWYVDFTQTRDEEVVDLLKKSRPAG